MLDREYPGHHVLQSLSVRPSDVSLDETRVRPPGAPVRDVPLELRRDLRFLRDSADDRLVLASVSVRDLRDVVAEVPRLLRRLDVDRLDLALHRESLRLQLLYRRA